MDDDFHDDYDDDAPPDPETDFDAAMSLCYMHADGYCGAAGSEYCDWECPVRRHFASEAEFEEWRWAGVDEPDESVDSNGA